MKKASWKIGDKWNRHHEVSKKTIIFSSYSVAIKTGGKEVCLILNFILLKLTDTGANYFLQYLKKMQTLYTLDKNH